LTPDADTERSVSATGPPVRRRDDHGIVVVYFALALVVIMGFAAFVVDLGYWYYRAAQVQRAADAAALAGVVYMPGDFGTASTIADNVARDNGFDPAKYSVAVSPVPNAPHELTVTIKDPDVPTFFARAFGLTKVAETRTATAKYDTAIPLGSPENSFGTGDLSLGVGSPTNIWAAVNGYCTSKENGDQFLSRLDVTWNGSQWTCPSAPTRPAVVNDEYDATGYYYDVVTPNPTGTLSAPITVQAYDPAYEPAGCSGTPDLPLGSGTSITTSYALTYAPVPLDHTKDVPVPGVSSPITFASGDAASCAKWATLFTIPAGQPNGEYRVEVYTKAGEANSDGSNSYGLRVYQGASFSRCTTITGLAWYSAGCPVIHGDTALSVYANQAGGTGSFYLAAVDAQYAGHTMEVNLFDPGEGDHYIQVLDPSGNPAPFTYQTTDDNTGCPDCGSVIGFKPFSGSSTGVPGLDVSPTITPPPGEDSDSVYNDRHMQLTILIPPTYTAPNGGWWSIKYTSGNGSITDRTTWGVQILGDPVHLVQ
jgi:hypothetical protein